jgi:hypothetical protein
MQIFHILFHEICSCGACQYKRNKKFNLKQRHTCYCWCRSTRHDVIEVNKYMHDIFFIKSIYSVLSAQMPQGFWAQTKRCVILLISTKWTYHTWSSKYRYYIFHFAKSVHVVLPSVKCHKEYVLKQRDACYCWCWLSGHNILEVVCIDILYFILRRFFVWYFPMQMM